MVNDSWQERSIDLTKVPLAYAGGCTIKKAVHWHQDQILEGGQIVTDEILKQYADVAQYIPVSLRVVGAMSDVERQVEENMRRFREQRKADKLQDLSEAIPVGTAIFEQGDETNRDCFFLTEGSLDVLRDNVKLVTLSGTGIPVGEMSFLTGEPRSATVIAAEPVRLIRLSAAERDQRLRANPTLVRTLMKTLVERLNKTSSDLVAARDELATFQKSLAEAEALALESQAAASEDIAKLSDLVAMTKYAEKLSRLQLGNRELAGRLTDAMIRARDAGSFEPDHAIVWLQAFCEYLASQQTSAVVKPHIVREDLPEMLHSLLEDPPA